MKKTFTPWTQTVLYQLYTWTFNEDEEREPQLGHGSIRGLTEKIPYFVELGCDAVWVAPPFPGPMVDAGYDTTDMTAIHPGLGTLEDFDEFIAKCHEADIRVMLDIIPNHTSIEHEWFQKSRRREPGFEDWYIWHPGKLDENGKRVPPNNWASDFSQPNRKARDRGEMPWLKDDEWTPPIPAWLWDDVRGEYYLHHFLKEQADLNWSKPEVRDAIKDIMRFWLDRGVDAFRLDGLNHMAKNMDFPDEEINPDYNEKDYDNPYYQLQQRHGSNYPETLHFYMQELCSVMHEDAYKDRDIILMLEAQTTEENLRDMNAIDPKVATAFNFGPLIHPEWNARQRKAQMDDYFKYLDDRNIPNHLYGTHDVSRLASRFGDAKARAFSLLLLAAPGMGVIYSGDELGLHDGDVPIEMRRDPAEFRDPDRTPIIWDDTKPNGGFSNADPKNFWLPVNDKDLHLAESRQRNDPLSTLALHKAAIRLRRELPAFKTGTYVPLAIDSDDVLAFERRESDQRAAVLVNFSDQPQRVEGVVGFAKGRIILSSIDVGENQRDIDCNAGIDLRPNEAIIVVPS